ncbi:expressed unknown protein [Seminavis robusta]|uniref:Uncharacterized protein n=1 Tax=Seminavis robusta TaxID=568900 RepID=A0A9N8DQK5_9STRA|nr:expressed unknown protein [Seminavis robusta]|eukprot:Sro281_g107260.1 n/a (520) ;mRNA; r:30254-31813
MQLSEDDLNEAMPEEDSAGDVPSEDGDDRSPSTTTTNNGSEESVNDATQQDVSNMDFDSGTDMNGSLGNNNQADNDNANLIDSNNSSNNSDAALEAQPEEDNHDDNNEQEQDKKARIFKKKTPEYLAFVELCYQRGWFHSTLPRSSGPRADRDLVAFLAATGFSREQIIRKYREFQRYMVNQEAPTELALLEAIREECNDKDNSKSNVIPVKLKAPPRKPSYKAVARAKSRQEPQENIPISSPKKQQQLPNLPPMDLRDIGYVASSPARAASPFLQQLRKVVSPTPWGADPPPSQLQRYQSWVKPNHQGGADEALPPPPPGLKRLATSEVTNLLQGPLYHQEPDPSMDGGPPRFPHPYAGGLDHPQQQQQESYPSLFSISSLFSGQQGGNNPTFLSSHRPESSFPLDTTAHLGASTPLPFSFPLLPSTAGYHVNHSTTAALEECAIPRSIITKETHLSVTANHHFHHPKNSGGDKMHGGDNTSMADDEMADSSWQHPDSTVTIPPSSHNSTVPPFHYFG